MSEQAKPFIWLGSDGHGRGVLWLDKYETQDGKQVHVDRLIIHAKGEPLDMDNPKSKTYTGIVQKPENLKHVDPKRLQQWVDAGQAEYIQFIEKVGLIFKPNEDTAESVDETLLGDEIRNSVLTSAATQATTEAAHAEALQVEVARAEGSGAGPK